MSLNDKNSNTIPYMHNNKYKKETALFLNNTFLKEMKI